MPQGVGAAIRFAITFATALMALIALGRPAAATPILQLSIAESGYATTYVSTTPGNTISFTGNYGQYVNIAGTGLQIIGYGDDSGISFTVQIAKTTAAYSALTISLTETELPASPGTVILFQSYTSATLHTASTLTTHTYYDLTDTPYGTQNLINSRTQTGPLSTTGTETDLAVPIGQTYSITKVATLTPTANAFPTYGPQLYVTVPEPSSFAVFGLMVPSLLMLHHRRRGKAAA